MRVTHNPPYAERLRRYGNVQDTSVFVSDESAEKTIDWTAPASNSSHFLIRIRVQVAYQIDLK